MSDTLAIIGGTGLTRLPGLRIRDAHDIQTPYGAPSGSVLEGVFQDSRIFFMARHGHPHRIPPHRVNYRANIWALRHIGARDIISVNAVGGITKSMHTRSICIPDQIIDYTHSRESSFYDGVDASVVHVDFSYPYTEVLRSQLMLAAKAAKIAVINGGVYGATQGPRLETAAEIARMEKDGCDIVGMTGMPEAVLAREAKMGYAGLSLVVNPAAGKAKGVITIKEIDRALDAGMEDIRKVLSVYVERFVVGH